MVRVQDCSKQYKFANLSDNGEEKNNVLVPRHKATVGGP